MTMSGRIVDAACVFELVVQHNVALPMMLIVLRAICSPRRQIPDPDVISAERSKTSVSWFSSCNGILYAGVVVVLHLVLTPACVLEPCALTCGVTVEPSKTSVAMMTFPCRRSSQAGKRSWRPLRTPWARSSPRVGAGRIRTVVPAVFSSAAFLWSGMGF